MHLLLVITVEQKAAGVLIFSGLIAPVVGVALRRHIDYGTYGSGPFAILSNQYARRSRAPHRFDPAMQAAEVRQMLIAKAERQRRRGAAEIDVDAEAARLLTRPETSAPDRIDAELRAEIRQLVVVRNERRARQGLAPLNVSAETERQLADL